MTKSIVAALQLGASCEGTAKTLEHVLSYKDRIQDSNCDLLV